MCVCVCTCLGTAAGQHKAARFRWLAGRSLALTNRNAGTGGQKSQPAGWWREGGREAAGAFLSKERRIMYRINLGEGGETSFCPRSSTVENLLSVRAVALPPKSL